MGLFWPWRRRQDAATPPPERRRGERRRTERRHSTLPDGERRQGDLQRQHERRVLVGAALNVTGLIRRNGVHLASGSIWDLSEAGLCLCLPLDLDLAIGSDVELDLITGQDAGGLRVAAQLCWTQASDGHWFAGFRFRDGGLPEDSSLSRLLRRSRAAAERLYEIAH